MINKKDLSIDEEEVDRKYPAALDISLLNWMLGEVEDMLIPDEILYEMINPDMINSKEHLITHSKMIMCGLTINSKKI